MNNKSKEFSFGKFLIQLTLFSIILYGVHGYIIQPYLSNYKFNIDTGLLEKS